MHVDGISGAEIDSILQARGDGGPFESLDDLCRRTVLSRPTVENLIHGGACIEFGNERDLLLRVKDLWDRRAPRPASSQPSLKVAEPPVSYGLRPYSDAERVKAELEVTGLDVTRHVLSFYEPLLRALRVTRSEGLRRTRQRQRVMVAGVKVASQTPAVRSGQRIIFLTLDDATGLVDVTVFESVQEHCAWTVFHSWLTVVRGTVHRTGARGVSINAERAWDLSSLAAMRRAGTLDVKAMWTEGVEELEAAERERRKNRGAAAHPTATMPRQLVLQLPEGASASEAPRKLWHASPGSAGA